MKHADERIKYSIVVPFYNEQESVRPLYDKITEVMAAVGESYEMVFVDDGSRDQTLRMVLDPSSRPVNSERPGALDRLGR